MPVEYLLRPEVTISFNHDQFDVQFWLRKLNQFGGNFEQAEMVKAFIISGEYRDRFPALIWLLALDCRGGTPWPPRLAIQILLEPKQNPKSEIRNFLLLFRKDVKVGVEITLRAEARRLYPE